MSFICEGFTYTGIYNSQKSNITKTCERETTHGKVLQKGTNMD